MAGRSAAAAFGLTRSGTSPPPAVYAAGSTVAGPDAVEAALRYADEVRGVAGTRAVVFHLSRLQRSHRRDKHVTIAANMLSDVVKQHHGRLFLLPNRDVVLICRGLAPPTITDARDTLQYLFNDDPVAQPAAGGKGFCSQFDLQSEHPQFVVSLARRQVPPLPAPGQPAPLPFPDSSPADGTLPENVLDTAAVTRLLEAVNRLDLAPLLRRQNIWRVVDGAPPRAVAEEVFVSPAELRKALGPAAAAASDHQLFAYVTRRLDTHLLRTLALEHFDNDLPVSLNINVASLRSPDFAMFDLRRPSEWRDRIMVEMQLADIWADLPSFFAHSEKLKRDGYRRCIDGVVFSALRFLNLRLIDVDYVKVIWDDALLGLGDRELRHLCDAIADCGRERIILTRCGPADAIRIGRALGIELFQGWALGRRPSASSTDADA